MNCSRCAYPNRPDARFCQRCGQPLSTALPDQAICVNCHRALRSGARFCVHCGARQLTELPPASLPPPRPSPGSQPSPASLPSRTQLGNGKHTRSYIVRHSALIALLTFGLVAALAAALVVDSGSGKETSLPPTAIMPAMPTAAPTPTADYREAVVEIGYDTTGRFGLQTLQGDPATRSDDDKLLTFDFEGATNNTRIWIDGDTPIYGGSTFLGFGLSDLVDGPDVAGGQISSVWEKTGIRVEQTLMYARGSTTERVDTMLVKYVLSNRGAAPREVGLRIMLDTLIGDNDGVPFVVPGQDGIISSAVDLRDVSIPDFVQALERPDLADPGVIVNLTLRGADATPPDRLVISAWCSENAEWDYFASLGGAGHPLDRCGQDGNTPDSAVALYFDPQVLAPGEQRSVVTYYGLGGISSTESGNTGLSLTFNRAVRQGDRFWITALVVQPHDGQSVRLTLPPGLELASDSAADQPVVAGGDFTQVSWQVEALAPLQNGLITVTLSPDGLTETQSITVSPKSIVR